MMKEKCIRRGYRQVFLGWLSDFRFEFAQASVWKRLALIVVLQAVLSGYRVTQRSIPSQAEGYGCALQLRERHGSVLFAWRLRKTEASVRA